MEPIISVSGLRGVVGTALTPLVALRYVAAFVEDLPPGPIVLGRDGRATGAMLADVVRGGLRAAGRDVLDVGVAATPTIGVLTRAHGAAGGVQISASHNPAEYNGLKLFSPQGRVLTARQGEPVLARYAAGAPRWVGHDRVGNSRQPRQAIDEHLRRVLATVDVERVRARRFRVLLDANHGAGAVVGAPLLRMLGCEVTSLGAEPTGAFAHPPEPLAENLRGVAESVRAAGAAVGFCQDPDADRLALIDENGRYLGEEYTLALCLDHVLPRRPGAVVANCATSQMTAEVAGRHGCPFFRSAVGEANVVEVMLREGAVFGGEGNGGPIDPEVGYVRDSFVGMARVLDALAARDEPLSRWADSLPRFEIHKTKLDFPRERIHVGLAALEAAHADARADRQDGLHLSWPDGWLLVRASNTEPIVRIIAEAPTRTLAEARCARAQKVLAGV